MRDGLIAVRVGRLSYHQPYFQPMGLEAEAEGPHLGHWVHSQLHSHTVWAVKPRSLLLTASLYSLSSSFFFAIASL